MKTKLMLLSSTALILVAACVGWFSGPTDSVTLSTKAGQAKARTTIASTTPPPAQPFSAPDTGSESQKLDTAHLLSLIDTAPQSDEAFAAMQALGQAGKDTEAQLIAALAKASNAAKAQVLASALAINGSEDAVDAIWRASIAVKDPQMRTAILTAFDHVTTTEGINLIASAIIASSDAEVLQAAMRTVARASTADTVDFLGELYIASASQPALRTQIATALTTITTPDAEPALSALARRGDLPDLASAAATSLAKSGSASASLALALAFESTPPGTPLAQTQLESFSGTRVTEDNIAFLTMQAEQSTSPEWRATAQKILSAAKSTSL